MGSTEAAASLFGPGDSLSSDPFATLGTEGNQERSDDIFAGVGVDDSVQSAPDSNNPAGPLVQPGDVTSAFQVQPAAQTYGSSNYYTPARGGGGTGELYGLPPQQTDNHSYYGTQLSSNAPYTSPVIHDPYAPPALNYAPSSDYKTPASQAPTSPYLGNTVSSYDGYNSSQFTSSSHYPAYAPTTTSGTPTTPASSYTGSQSSSYASLSHPPSKASLATVPSPPVPTATQVTRPKISNAYDPPFPVTSYSRRNVSGPAKFGQVPISSAHSTYATYQSTPPPPSAPPPPRSPGYTFRHTQTSEYSLTQASVPAPPSWVGEADALSPTLMHSSHNPNTPPQLSQTEHIPSPPRPIVSQPDNHISDSQISIEESIPAEASSTPDHGMLDPQGDLNDSEAGVPAFLSDSQPSPAPVVSQRPHSPGYGSTSPNTYPAQDFSSGTFKTTSSEGAFEVASSLSRTSLDSKSNPSPQQSPRPSSASSPVYALPQSLRRSPELYKGSITRYDYTPRARTTSPGIDGSVNTANSYAPPRSKFSPSKSASTTSLDQLNSRPFSSMTTLDQGAHRNGFVLNAYSPERIRSPLSAVSARLPDGRQNIKSQSSPYLPPVSESLPQQEPRPVAGYAYPQSQQNYNIQPSSSTGHQQTVYGYSPELSPPSEANVRPTITPYAPSPSLMGANDPLGRTSVRVPVFSFGFGGKLIVCFHNEGMLNTGFDVALSSRTSTKVQLRSWKKYVPESVQDSGAGFPGPLHADPGPPNTGIMKATSSTQAKTKKAQLVKYLSDRIEEITQGLGYQHSGSPEKRMVEGKLILVKLLKIMVENDGRLLGTPQLDSAVRSTLLPRLEGALSTSDSGGNFTLATDAATMFSESSYGSTGADATPISVTTVRASALDKIEEFLLRGDRRQACHYALDQKLWAHAMVIASSIDKEAWKEAVNEFIKADLGVKGEASFTLPGRNGSPATNGRESLRMAYSLFSGQGAAAALELVPKSSLARAGNFLPAATASISTPSLPLPTPRTPNFSVPMVGTKMPIECLSKWAESAAMLILSPFTNDASAALTALGDQLMTNGWLEAAHVCYLLSPQTAPLGGVGNPAARIVLLSSKSPATCTTFWRDPDSIIFTEILEYALAIAPVPKGQEPNHGIPHLQAYRLLRAFSAAEAGDLSLASRYCEAITASLVRGSSYYTPVMLEELKGLSDRLSGVSQSDKASSWMGGKISKPTFDGLQGWLEGRFTKLVTGDSDGPSSPQEDGGKMDMRSYTGPFTHYNTISSTTSSARSSPAPSFVPAVHAMSPRNDSTALNKSPYGYGPDRPPPVGDTMRMSSPGPSPSQARPANATVSSYPSIQTELNSNNGYSNGYGSPGSDLQTPKPPHHGNKDDEANAQEVTWWGSSSYGDVGITPTAARFEKAGEGYDGMDSNGYFSPMANQTFGTPSPATPSTPSRQASMYQDDEDDDLGLGNNASKKKEATPVNGEDTQAQTAPVSEEKKVTQPPQTQPSGWFSRWWKRDNTQGGPVKASLGEESTFYYDKDLKRWVNKKAGEETTKPSPPPPPPRAQTASPAMSGPKPPGFGISGMANGSGFDMRPTSAVDLTSPPNAKGAMRVRSSLAPPGLDSAPPTPTGNRLMGGNGPTPPPGRPRSQASQKKSVRSRYVDVFSQGVGA